MQISFCMRKLKSTSKEDVDPFCCEEKFSFASKEDADPFSFKEKFKSASKKDVDPFYFEEKKLITCRSLKLRNKLHQRTYFHKPKLTR